MQDGDLRQDSFLDRTLAGVLRLAESPVRWDVEKLIWIVIIAAALLTRLIGLGDRAMSHDESLHTVYSYQLYDGRGYEHQPMMHGPLKFILNPVMYFLFGVNDWSSRALVALFGVAMVAFVWMLRPWLGRTGALLAAVMYAISPALLYHSRYIRDEVILTSLTVFLVVAIFRYLETRASKWLIWTAVALGLSFLTMEASFIFGGILGIFLVLALAAQLWAAAWPVAAARDRTASAESLPLTGDFAARGGEGTTDRRLAFRVLFLLSLALLAIGLALVVFQQMTAGIVLLALGAVGALATVSLAAFSWRSQLRRFAELDLIVLLITLVMPFLSAVVLKALGWQISQFNSPSQVDFNLIWQGGLVLLLLFVLSGLIGFFWLRRRWLVAAGIFWAIEILFFTTFFTNGQGIGTGLIGSLGYWIEQQEVMRGGQPWYYFYLMVPLYEFLPLVLWLCGALAWPVSVVRRRRADAAAAGSAASAAAASGAAGAPEAAAARPPIRVQCLFEAFLVFWPLATWAVFTYVGEKMPWHTVYFAMGMAPLGALWLGRLIEGIDWRSARQRGTLWLVLLAPLLGVAVKALLPIDGRRPFGGVSVGALSNTLQWIAALVTALVLIYFIYDRLAAGGWRLGLKIVTTTLAGLLAVYTVGVSLRFSFITYDYAVEPMVYAHATPDIKLAMDQIEEISLKTAGDHSLRVAYDDDSTWPLEWYLRDYWNKVYYAASPSRDSMNSPVVIAGDKNVSKVRPYLGDDYHEFNYRLIWWPRETYKNLSWQRLLDGVRDPVQRGQFWDVVLHRRYTTDPAQWDPIHRFSLFVRKDIAGQVWDWGVTTAVETGDMDGGGNPYEEGRRTIKAIQQIGIAGVAGSEPGQLTSPRAVAVDDEGRIYVADSGNHRVQVFDAQGALLRQWGSLCNLDTREGCTAGGEGQFNEPWGIAVGDDGSVYVSDTWNHRIQKFDSSGRFLTAWGSFGSTGGELGQASLFYGPRAVIVGRDGNVYVMDTGNKRVQVFDPQGRFISQWGGGGVVDGRFDEPVGLAQDATGNWYVADTWNLRIQKFDEMHQYTAQWAVDGWASQSVVNKPALAIDPERELVYAVDPENYRVLAFRTDGSFVATWGLYGMDMETFALPTGIAVGPDGKVYVADGDAHRILIFEPIEQRTTERSAS